MNLQPTFENDIVLVRPLVASDFDALFTAASDSKIWEQHPNKNRYQLSEFTLYFEGAMQSGGAFCVIEKATNTVIGSTRYYDVRMDAPTSVVIGYTFYTTACWGKGYNPMVKKMMLQYAFQYVDEVYFHIGAVNKRSQMAIGKIGAIKIAEKDIAYYGAAPQLNFVYRITKNDFI